MRHRGPLAALMFLTALQAAADWPVFRGPGSAGASHSETPLGEVTGLGLEVVWKHTLGSGYSAVSVASGHAVTLFSDGTIDLAVAFEAATGEELWRYPLGPTYRGHDGSHDGPISTPLIADGRVFALGPWGHFYALDLRTGEKIWSTHLSDDQGAMAPLYGYGTSPVLADGVVVVAAGAHGGPFAKGPPGSGPSVLGFDPASGEVLWQVGKDTVNYQSPMPTTVGGEQVVLATTDVHLYGLEARTGKVLWKLAHGGSFYAGSGTQSMNPVALGGGRFFITDDHDSSSVVAVAPDAEGQMALVPVWSGRSIRDSYAIPVFHEGHLYGYSGGFLTCVDAETGDRVWRSRAPGDGFPILVDAHLVVMTKKGSLHVAEASPERYREVAGLELFDASWTPPSFAGGRIYARGLDAVAAVELDAGGPAATAETDEVRRASGATAAAGTRLARFLTEIEVAPEKALIVDRFLASVESFPLVESDESTGGEVTVHFLYRGEARDMGIAGDMIATGQQEPMTRVPGTDLFYYSARLLENARVSYSFIRDFEERLTDPRNPRKAPDVLGEVSWVGMPGWEMPAHLAEAPEERRGRLESLELESTHRQATRHLDVYLPAGYDDEAERRYPVVYVHGGMAALKLGGWQRTLDNLISRSIEPLIAVFIDTQGPRGDELAFSTRDAYAAMFAEEIVPAIDEKYRTLAAAESRAGVGTGTAGYAALYVAFRQPGVVSKVASQSTFLLTMQTMFLGQLVGGTEKQPLAIFIEWGAYDQRSEHEAWDFRIENRKLANLLAITGYEVTAGEIPEGSGWPAWRNRTDDILEWLFPLSP